MVSGTKTPGWSVAASSSAVPAGFIAVSIIPPDQLHLSKFRGGQQLANNSDLKFNAVTFNREECRQRDRLSPVLQALTVDF